MWSIQAAVAYLRARSVRTLRDPANHRARSFRTWKMHLVIEHNHQSFEQLGTSSRDIRSKFILSREAQSFRACGIEMCVVNRAQSLPPTVSPHRHHPLLFSVLRDSIHSRDLGNPANELSPTISPHREDHPPPLRGWRGTKAGLLGIKSPLDRRQGDLYKGTIPRRNHSPNRRKCGLLPPLPIEVPKASTLLRGTR